MERNKIYKQDCIAGMREHIDDESVDLILTDLPYGVLSRDNPHAKWDNVIPFEDMWREYLRVIKDNGAICLFGDGGLFTARLVLSQERLFRYNIVWKKGSFVSDFMNAKRKPLRNHEVISVFYKKSPTFNPQKEKGDAPSHSRGTGTTTQNLTNRACGALQFVSDTEAQHSDMKYPKTVIDFEKPKNGFHPTEKPVPLMEWFIKSYTNPGELVLDSCMGSGTTAIACLNTGRDYLGFEIVDKYYDYAMNRIAEWTPTTAEMRKKVDGQEELF